MINIRSLVIHAVSGPIVVFANCYIFFANAKVLGCSAAAGPLVIHAYC